MILKSWEDVTVRLLLRGPLSQSWPIGLQENNNIIPRKSVVGQSAAHKKTLSYSKHNTQNLINDRKRFFRMQNVSKDNVCVFETLHMTPRRDYLFDTSWYFVIYQQFLCYHCHALKQNATWSQNCNSRLRFSPPSLILTDLSGKIGTLQRIQKITYVGCDCLVSIHVVYFVSWSLLSFQMQLFRERLSETVHATIPERYCGWFWNHCFSEKFERMTREAIDRMFTSAKRKQKK